MYVESNLDEERLASILAIEYVRRTESLGASSPPKDYLAAYRKAYGEIMEELKRH